MADIDHGVGSAYLRGHADLLNNSHVIDPKSRTPFSVRVTEKLSDFQDFWPRTDRLGKARCYVFQCADILETWCDTFGVARKIVPVFIGIFDRDGQPLMLLPFGIQRRNTIRVLTFLDGGISDYNAPVLFPGAEAWDAAMMHRIWNELTSILPEFDFAELIKLPGHVGDIANPLLLLGASTLPYSSHAATLTGTWEAFARKRLPKRDRMIRNRRHLSKMGVMSFLMAKTPAEHDAFLDAMIRQKTRKYLKTRGFDQFNWPGSREYLAESTRRLAGSKALHLSVLRLNDTIVATHWGYVLGNRFYYMMPSYEDGEWSRYSPGRLLLEHLLQWCFVQGIEIFDFGPGDEDYKREYSDVIVPLHRLAIPITAVGRAYHLFRKAKNKIKRTKVWWAIVALRARFKIATRPSE